MEKPWPADPRIGKPWIDDEEPTRETVEFTATYHRSTLWRGTIVVIAVNVCAWIGAFALILLGNCR